MIDLPYYSGVPKDFDKNLTWRKQLLSNAANDPKLAAAARQMCAEDILFYMNGFCFTYDPRDQKMPNKPFITYDFQDESIMDFVSAINSGYDIAWPKSRTMGASWMALSVIEWFWHFKHDLSFLLISRNEKYVDQSGNPKSLFWKIDFIHQNQPRWLLPNGRWLGSRDPNRHLLHLKNADTNSVIDGESTTGDAGRGDRRTAMLIDEHAAFELNDGFKVLKSSRDTTKCRLFNSTPQGANNAFHEVVKESGAKVSYLHWTEHPIYKAGLYTSEKVNGVNQLKMLDDSLLGTVRVMRKDWAEPKDVNFPDDYPFILDGKTRSPWYDTECSRCVSPQEIAQELDIDFLGSAYQYFDQDFIRKLISEYCMEPYMTGNLVYEPETLEPLGFEPNPKGQLQLWFNIAGNTNILTDRSYFDGKFFGIGSDVSMGTGASNSATSVVDLTTGKKIALWKDAHTEPGLFADITIALAKWFNNGMLIWDGSGPTGRVFTKRVIEKAYTHVYYRADEEKFRQRISNQPGFYLNPEDRAIVLRDYRSALEKRDFINLSETGMKETLQFIVEPGGRVEHSAAMSTQDPSGAREAHGDEVIADALVSRLRSLNAKDVELKEREIPYMSPAWRFQQEKLELAKAAQDEDW